MYDGARIGERRRRASSALRPQSGPSWSSLCRGLKAHCYSVGGCLVHLAPQRPRILAVLLLATGAYCFILHQQQYSLPPPPPPHLMLSAPRGNRSRPVVVVRVENNSASAAHRKKRMDGSGEMDVDAVYSASLDGGEEVAIDGVTTDDTNWESELEEELGRRRARVWEVCKANGLVAEDGTGAGDPNAWEFFIDERHRLVWCNIFKAASSSWMYNFNLLAGYKEQYLRRSKKSPLALARERFPRPTAEQLKNVLPYSLSFLIVRDPFERLLSAYRNKIEGFRHKFYRKMAREMMSKFRVRTTPGPGTRRNNNGRGDKNQNAEKSPTFSEFVSWVIASAKKARGSKTGGYNGVPGFDEHWAPYFRFCTPCAVNFTVIAKTDTLNRDETYIIHKTGIGPALGRKPGREVPREAINAAVGGRTQDLLPKYFQTLSREQLDALYDIYRIDFQMFGYDASKYFEIVSPE